MAKIPNKPDCGFPERGGPPNITSESDRMLREFLKVGPQILESAVAAAYKRCGRRPQITLEFYERDELNGATRRRSPFIWGFSTYVLFRHLAVPGPVFETLDNYSHTPPQLRATQAIGIFRSIVLDKTQSSGVTPAQVGFQELHAAIADLSAAVRISELAMADAAGEPPDLVPLEQALNEEGRQLLLRDYRKAWAAVRPKLETHAFVGLSPAMT